MKQATRKQTTKAWDSTLQGLERDRKWLESNGWKAKGPPKKHRVFSEITKEWRDEWYQYFSRDVPIEA